eukprot:TRINITY_DN4679_c0_g1_i2.p1 TRINITY_DN4679_c0_g1~~TRINITY_DN4679_c0_g1_i2.p1  ORF type:complete len:349 (+),score=117.98 TRINITY_DN4679_c0_g1_i2:475-1521(+)
MGQMFKPFILQMEQQYKSQLQSGGHQYNFPLMDNPMRGPSNPTPVRSSLPTQAPSFTPLPSDPIGPFSPLASPSSPTNSVSTPSKPIPTSNRKWITSSSVPFLSNQMAAPVVSKKFAEYHLSATENEVLANVINYLSNPAEEDAEPPVGAYTLFDRILGDISPEKLFGCLYIFRVFILRRRPNENYAKFHDLSLMSTLVECLEAPKATQAMALTVASNFFAWKAGANWMCSHASQIVPKAIKALQTSDPALHSTAAALLYNYSLNLDVNSDSALEATLAINEFLRTAKDPETIFRLLLSLGHFVMRSTDGTLGQLVMASDFDDIVKLCSGHADAKISEVMSELKQIMQ